MNVRVAICDDDKVSRDELRTFCKRFFDGEELREKISDGDAAFRGESLRRPASERERPVVAPLETEIVCEVEEYTSGEAYLAAESADIVLLDIEMGGMDGIEVRKNMTGRHGKTKIIFVTSHDEIMQRAFGTNVCGFLTKPLQYGEFAEKMLEVLQEIERTHRVLEMEIAGERKYFRTEEVLYMAGHEKDVDIHTVNGVHPSTDRRGIGCWEEELKKEHFARPHKSYLVNLVHVKRVGQDVLLDNGEHVKLSRDRKKAFEEKYLDYQEWKMYR